MKVILKQEEPEVLEVEGLEKLLSLVLKKEKVILKMLRNKPLKVS